MIEFYAKSPEEAEMLEWMLTRLEAVYWLFEVLGPFTYGQPNRNGGKGV